MTKFWRGVGALFIGLGVYNMTVYFDNPLIFGINLLTTVLWTFLVIQDND